MFKNVFAFVGLLVMVAGVGVWQFGFLSAKVDEVSLEIERKTAVSRAHSVIDDMKQRAAKLSDTAREKRIDARKREMAIEREQAEADKTREALAALAQAAKEAGFPKPTAATQADLDKTLMFAGRSLTGKEVYDTLTRWQADAERIESRLAVTSEMIQRIRDTADQLESKQEQFIASIQQTEATLEKLEMQRDLAALDKELAELGASANSNPAGELQELLTTLQIQTDEYEATRDILADEATKGNALTPGEALTTDQIEVTRQTELDSLWSDAEADAQE